MLLLFNDGHFDIICTLDNASSLGLYKANIGGSSLSGFELEVASHSKSIIELPANRYLFDNTTIINIASPVFFGLLFNDAHGILAAEGFAHYTADLSCRFNNDGAHCVAWMCADLKRSLGQNTFQINVGCFIFRFCVPHCLVWVVLLGADHKYKYSFTTTRMGEFTGKKKRVKTTSP